MATFAHLLYARTLASPHWRALTCPSTVLLLAGLGSLLFATRWFVLNVEPSVPTGLYRKVALPDSLARGMLVILPVPSAVWPWHVRRFDFMKPIGGIAGDQVCVLSAGLWINGEPYGPVYTKANGLAFPRLRGCFVVAEGTVFLATKTFHTLDSRYFGAVPIASLKAMALPLWLGR
jgi:type IV secretory pathway protease TraF